MNQQNLLDILAQNPVIAAVRDAGQLNAALAQKTKVVFLLSGSINSLADDVQALKSLGLIVFLHVDLIDGLRPDQQGMRFVADVLKPSGIISTKPACIKWARGLDLLSIQRIFMLDSTAVANGLRNIEACQPDLVEILPGVSERLITLANQSFCRPLIAGGLIQNRDEIYKALAAGALAVSTSAEPLWAL